MNSFSLGAQVGGRLAKDASAQEQELRDMFNEWTGDYSSAVREFAFILRIDGEFHSYTEMWSIRGAQKAKTRVNLQKIWCLKRGYDLNNVDVFSQYAKMIRKKLNG